MRLGLAVVLSLLVFHALLPSGQGAGYVEPPPAPPLEQLCWTWDMEGDWEEDRYCRYWGGRYAAKCRSDELTCFTKRIWAAEKDCKKNLCL